MATTLSIPANVDRQPMRETPRQLCDELVDAERLVDDLFDELQRMRGEAAALKAQRDELEAAYGESFDQLAAATRQLAEANAEKQLLGAELDVTRTAVAEGKRRMTELRRELKTERETRQAEIGNLHKLVERFFERWSEDVVSRSAGPRRPREADAFDVKPELAAIEGPRSSPAEGDGSAGLEAKPTGGDPVVHSVMAQFSKLQKDVARRRGKRP